MRPSQARSRIEEIRLNPYRTEKTCSVCHLLKPLDDFYLGWSSVDGRAGTCKRCALERTHKRWISTPEEPVTVTEKWCPSCRRLLPSDLFWRSTKEAFGLQSNCKDCHYAYGRGETAAMIRRRLKTNTGPRTRIVNVYPRDPTNRSAKPADK